MVIGIQTSQSRHYSRRTEQPYSRWVTRFVYFYNIRPPAETAEPEINSFLTHPAVMGKVSASTHSQVLSAFLFVYRHVIGCKVGDLCEVIRAQIPAIARCHDARRSERRVGEPAG